MALYTLPDMPYNYAALEPVITGEILDLHHAKHHAAYVKAANDTLEQLEEARSKEVLPPLVGLEKTLAFNLSGHVLHTIFWQNLSPEGGDRPEGELAAAIDEDFEPLSRRLIVEQVYDHHGNVGLGSTPLLVFDAWEHAYYLQYRNVRPDYVQKLWSLVNWTDVDRRFQAARQIYVESAQRAAGVVAARARGDLPGAEALPADFPSEAAKAMGFFLLAELALQTHAKASGQDIEAVTHQQCPQVPAPVAHSACAPVAPAS